MQLRRKEMTNSTISGHVLDNLGRPVPNVKVNLNGKLVAQSLEDGFFSVPAARPEPRMAFTFSESGYVSNTRVFEGRTVASHHTVVLWPVMQSLAFDTVHDLDVEFQASRLRIPANALAGPEHRPFRGRARLDFTLFDVSSPLQRSAASGDYSALLADGSVRRLNSWGIFDLAVRDTEGRPLELAPGAKAELAIPIPRRLRNPPRSVGYFDFETRSGRWIPAGEFTLDPTTRTYNGTITRFAGPDGSTQHNIDEPQDTTCVTIRVLNYWNTAPLANFTVEVHGAQYTSTGTTDSNGYACVLVQRNSTFTAKAYGHIGSSDYGTPTPSTLTSPDFSSGAGDCGDPDKCPFIGVVNADLIVHMMLARESAGALA
jgi:hypothetical protein